MSGNMIVFKGICNNVSDIMQECGIPEEKYDAICRYLAIISIMFEATQQKSDPKPVKVRRKRRTKEEINAERSRNNETEQNISGQTEQNSISV